MLRVGDLASHDRPLPHPHEFHSKMNAPGSNKKTKRDDNMMRAYSSRDDRYAASKNLLLVDAQIPPPAMGRFAETGVSRNRPEGVRGVSRHSNKHTPRNNPEVQGAFKILMIHWILQFALRIAFRCVLHRCGSQDIRR